MSAAWALEWRLALRRRRLLALNVLVPLALVAPLAAGAAPPHHAAAVYTVLFVLFGTFGATIPWVRDGETGWLERLVLRGPTPGSLLFGRSAAAAALDVLELTPALGLALAAARAPAGEALAAFAALGLALAFGNLIGCWAASAARSVAEAALFASVSALLLLHAAGTFRTPRAGSAGAWLEALSPFRILHESLLAALGPGGPPAPVAWASGAGVLLAAIVLTGLAAPRLVGAIARSRG